MPASTEKLDLMKLHRDEYRSSQKPVIVTVRKGKYLVYDGQGEPGGEAFQTGVEALYQSGYALKMEHKAAGRDYKVCALEGLWWGVDDSASFADQPRSTWNWKLMIRVPEFVTQEDLGGAISKLLKKGKGPAVEQVRLETMEEGRCVQMLHIGPYSSEGESIGRMKDHAAGEGLSFHGRHHEIYLSDPGRVPPEKLRTIIRQPVR